MRLHMRVSSWCCSLFSCFLDTFCGLYSRESRHIASCRVYLKTVTVLTAKSESKHW